MFTLLQLVEMIAGSRRVNSNNAVKTGIYY